MLTTTELTNSLNQDFGVWKNGENGENWGEMGEKGGGGGAMGKQWA